MNLSRWKMYIQTHSRCFLVWKQNWLKTEKRRSETEKGQGRDVQLTGISWYLFQECWSSRHWYSTHSSRWTISLTRCPQDCGGASSRWPRWATVTWCRPPQQEGMCAHFARTTGLKTEFYILKTECCLDGQNWMQVSNFHVLSRCVGMLCAITGMIITGLPIPIVASNFNHFYKCAKLKENMEKRSKNKKTRHCYSLYAWQMCFCRTKHQIPACWGSFGISLVFRVFDCVQHFCKWLHKFQIVTFLCE